MLAVFAFKYSELEQSGAIIRLYLYVDDARLNYESVLHEMKWISQNKEVIQRNIMFFLGTKIEE